MARQPHALSNFLLRAIALRRRQIAGLAVLAAIAQAYKTRFHQQSVGTILRPACVSF